MTTLISTEPRPGDPPFAPWEVLTEAERTSHIGRRSQVAGVRPVGIVARSMPLGQYATGVLFFLPTAVSVGAASAILIRRRYRYLSGVARPIAYMVLATAGMVLATVLPAALGVLTRGTMLATALMALGASLLVRDAPTRDAPAAEAVDAPPPSGRLSILIAVAAVGAVVVYQLARLRLLLTAPISDIDMLGFHLPGIARFIQTGSLWQANQFEPGFATGQYPNNGDFLILSVVLPWRDLAFVRLLPLPYFAFTGIGTYALGLELSATRAAAATMAAAVVAAPALALLALQGLPDAISTATFAAGLVFLLRYMRSGRRSELVLTGLALGLSLGTKWYGLTSVLVVGCVWLGAGLLRSAYRPRLLRDLGLLVAAAFMGGGIWLIRNLVVSGNPLYPKAVSLLGLQLFAGSHGDVVDRYGYTIADYLLKPHVLSAYIYPGFKQRVGLFGAVAAVGLLVAIGAAARDAWRRRLDVPGARVLALIVATLGIAAVYVITPGSAYGTRDHPVAAFVNIRWLMPAIVLVGALAAHGASRLRRIGILLELGGLAGALDGLHLDGTVAGSTVAKLTLVLAALAAAWILARRLSPGVRRSIRRPAWGATAVVVGLVAAAGLGRLQETRFDRHTYASYDPTFAWIDAHARTRTRIALVGGADTGGLEPALPAFGPRLGNVVVYVGQRVRGSVHLPSARAPFAAALRRGRFRLVLVGLAYAGPTTRWVPEAGYRLVARSARLALYEAT